MTHPPRARPWAGLLLAWATLLLLHAAPSAAQGGACGSAAGEASCTDGQCCSEWGYCGTAAEHCGPGCQASYGTCGGGDSTAVPTSPSPSPSWSEPIPTLPPGDRLSITASTLEMNADGTVNTWIAPLATALLAQGLPGLFWGAIPAADVNAACSSIVNTGSYSIPMDITGYGQTFAVTMTVQAIGGCLAGDTAPVGTQAVLVDEHGREFAIICTDEYTHELGCSVYMTGADVASISDQLAALEPDVPAQLDVSAQLQSASAAPADGGAPLGAEISCGVVTATSGIVIGSVVAGCTIASLGFLAPLCAVGGAIASVAAVGGSLGACGRMMEHEAETGCFPAHAAALLCDGRQARMDSLRLGDSLAVRRPDGSMACDPIYAWGHQQGKVHADFVRIQLAGADGAGSAGAGAGTGATTITAASSLELTPGHFVPVMGPHGRTVHKRARDVVPGDVMWVVNPHHILVVAAPAEAEEGLHAERATTTALAAVTSVSRTRGQGLFNPITLGGTLVVNSTLASAHSEWFADAAFDALGLPGAWLPALYQAALAPVRMLWHALGEQAFRQLYERLDGELRFATLCSAGTAGGWGLLGMVYAVGRALAAAAAAHMPFAAGGVATAVAVAATTAASRRMRRV